MSTSLVSLLEEYDQIETNHKLWLFNTLTDLLVQLKSYIEGICAWNPITQKRVCAAVL
jgi:hypothetical protein